jgi:diguanylate cyclase (GGDEF)-like protein
VTFELCERFGFDAAEIAGRISLVGLAGQESLSLSQKLQESVIRPNSGVIVDTFLSSLIESEQFTEIVSKHSDATRLKGMFEHYLLGLSVDFAQPQYFEDRLRIGSVHQAVGIPQSLYQCSFQSLQGLLIRHVPDDMRRDSSEFDEMVQFILNITALDMSLAIDSYTTSSLSGLERSLKDQRGESERLRHLALTDWLTGLHNHSHSRHLLEKAMLRSRMENSLLCIIMADLDHFKKINDRYGHLVGDEVLKIAASRMLSGARAEDEICRYGGEEFLIILQGTDITMATEVAERVRSRINGDAMHSQKAKISLSLSLGIAQARDDDEVDTLIERADAALYEAKQAGRDCVCLEA